MFSTNDDKNNNPTTDEWITHLYELILKYPVFFRLEVASHFFENALKNKYSPTAFKFIKKNATSLANHLLFFGLKTAIDKDATNSQPALLKKLDECVPALTDKQKMEIAFGFHLECIRCALDKNSSSTTPIAIYNAIEEMVKSLSQKQLAELEEKQVFLNKDQTPGDMRLWKMVSHLDKDICIKIAEGVQQKFL